MSAWLASSVPRAGPSIPSVALRPMPPSKTWPKSGFKAGTIPESGHRVRRNCPVLARYIMGVRYGKAKPVRTQAHALRMNVAHVVSIAWFLPSASGCVAAHGIHCSKLGRVIMHTARARANSQGK